MGLVWRDPSSAYFPLAVYGKEVGGGGGGGIGSEACPSQSNFHY